MVDIHDRRPLVLTADAIREWLSEDTTPERAQQIAQDAALPEKDFCWHPVSARAGSIRNQGETLIEEIKPD